MIRDVASRAAALARVAWYRSSSLTGSVVTGSGQQTTQVRDGGLFQNEAKRIRNNVEFDASSLCPRRRIVFFVFYRCNDVAVRCRQCRHLSTLCHALPKTERHESLNSKREKSSILIPGRSES